MLLGSHWQDDFTCRDAMQEKRGHLGALHEAWQVTEFFRTVEMIAHASKAV